MSILPGILTPLFLSKIVIAGILLVFLYNLIMTIIFGRKTAEWTTYVEQLDCFGIEHCEYVQVDLFKRDHKKYAKRSFWILILGVAVVDSAVHLFGNPVYDTLFWVHLGFFAIPCLIFFVSIYFKFTGLNYPELHGKLIYQALLPTLIGTLLTGIPLLYRL